MSQELSNILKQAEALSPDEQMLLIAHLAKHNRQALRGERVCRSWRDARGLAQHFLQGEDAQAWVSRTRAEADKVRAKGRS